MKHKKIRKILIEFGKEKNVFGTKDASIFLKNQRNIRKGNVIKCGII